MGGSRTANATLPMREHGAVVYTGDTRRQSVRDRRLAARSRVGSTRTRRRVCALAHAVSLGHGRRCASCCRCRQAALPRSGIPLGWGRRPYAAHPWLTIEGATGDPGGHGLDVRGDASAPRRARHSLRGLVPPDPRGGHRPGHCPGGDLRLCRRLFDHRSSLAGVYRAAGRYRRERHRPANSLDAALARRGRGGCRWRPAATRPEAPREGEPSRS